MVPPCPAGTTGQRSHRKTYRSPRTTRGGSARGARILRSMLRQRGKRCLDPVAIRPAHEMIMRRGGRSYRPRSTRRGGHQGKGMEARASGMAAPWGLADQDRPCRAKRSVTQAGTADLRCVGSRHAILDATIGRRIAIAAILTPARFDVRRLPTGRRGDAPLRRFLTVSSS
jgi:hypothetical protein